jgi:hypothetical protein
MNELELNENEITKIENMRKSYPFNAIGCLVPFFLLIILLFLLSSPTPIIFIVSFLTAVTLLVVINGNKYIKKNANDAIKDGFKIIVKTKLLKKEVIISSGGSRPRFIKYRLSFENNNIPPINVKESFYKTVNLEDEFKFEMTRRGSFFFRIEHKNKLIYNQLDLSTQNVYLQYK